MNRLLSSCTLIAILLLVGCSKAPEYDDAANSVSSSSSSTDGLLASAPVFKQRTLAQLAGTTFLPYSSSSMDTPTLELIPFAYPDNVDAIWGATGRDDAGNIYFGASSHGGEYGSAYLYQYNPVTDKVTPQSDVITELKRNGLYKPGMRQNKLHSKFYEADDGYLYFSSFDESGEAFGVNPYWGGHLWRKKPDSPIWEHLLATNEALVAVNTNGRFIYALGYWDHVLYQLDLNTNKYNRVVVGSEGMHMTRNFLVDERGHAFVPKLSRNDFNELSVTLEEYDTQLTVVGSHPLPTYQADDMEAHHGIVGYTTLSSGDIYFTTADGGLYVIIKNLDMADFPNLPANSQTQPLSGQTATQQSQPSVQPLTKVTYLGSVYEDGMTIKNSDLPYVPSLYPIPGTNILGSLATPNKRDYYWLTYQTDMGIKSTERIALPDGLHRTFFWGTLTKDNFGNYYVAGWSDADRSRKGMEPVFVKISPAQKAD